VLVLFLACEMFEERDSSLKSTTKESHSAKQVEKELDSQVFKRELSITETVEEISSQHEQVIGTITKENRYLYFQIWNTTIVQAGTFDRIEGDITQHVEIDYEFEIMKHELMQGTYQYIMDSNPSHFTACGLDCPVEKVNWYDAVLVANKLNELLGLEACYEIDKYDVTWTKGTLCQGWRLPTEAEWEYTAKAGEHFKYSGSDQADEVGWYRNNRYNSTQPVGIKKANAWGIYDMSGNVYEWCWDEYQKYTDKKTINPIGGTYVSSYRIYRGGCWNDLQLCMSHNYRRYYYPSLRYQFLGLRLVKTR
jgi:formylglycine-generating enzyme